MNTKDSLRSMSCSDSINLDLKSSDVFGLQNFSGHSKKCKVCEASSNITLANIQNKLEIHQMVQDSGRYNFEKCRIRVNDKINVNFMRIMLKDYSDLLVCDLLEFGFPLGFEGNVENLHSTDQI